MHKKPRSVVHLSPALKSLQATTITSKNIFKTLNSVRSAWSGVHKASYKLMGYAWQIVLLLRKNKELKAEFVSLAKLKVKKAKKRNIADAVMAYVMRARTPSEKKMAWKRSRGLQFLHDEGIKSNKIALEIEARGGIEEICKQAVEQTPRRKPKNATKNLGGNSLKASSEKFKKSRESSPIDKSDDSAATPSLRSNDQRAIMLLSIKLSDRDELSEMGDAKARLTIKRSKNQTGAKFTVLRVTKVPAKSQSKKP
jgi:hypothetical protein